MGHLRLIQTRVLFCFCTALCTPGTPQRAQGKSWSKLGGPLGPAAAVVSRVKRERQR